MAWTPEVAQSSRDPQCRLLPPEERLPVAHAPARVPALEDGVPLLQDVEDRWNLEEDEPGDAAAVEGGARPVSRAERGHRGQPIGEDDRRRRRAEGLRRGQEGTRQEEASARGHRRSGGRSQSSQREGPGPRWHQTFTRTGPLAARAPYPPVGGRGLPRSGQGVGGAGAWLGGRGGQSLSKTNPREGPTGVGERVVQGRAQDGFE